ncbi:MAG: PP2C family protein-serine/threonine phosphatase [Candidatus Wallbacteria bacterium]|nr:PP2C family protein-serine/threonine phosphatase [Candidatus Wallbacteria bacterium]
MKTSKTAKSSSVTNLKKNEVQLNLAMEVQDSFLPGISEVKWGYCQFGVQKINAQNASGDCYDLFPIEENRYFFLFGDVSGKGIPAALMMVHLLSSARFMVFRFQKPARIIYELNNEIHRLSSKGMFATLLCGILDLDRKELEFVNCGHLPLHYYSAGSKNWRILTNLDNVPLGIIRDNKFKTCRLPFQTGDTILMISDGVTEACDNLGREFSLEKIRSTFPLNGADPQHLVTMLFEALKKHCGNSVFPDDATIFAIQNSLQESSTHMIHPTMQGLEKIKEIVGPFLSKYYPDIQFQNKMRIAFPKLLFTLQNLDTTSETDKIWELKVVAKTNRLEVGIRTQGDHIDSEKMISADSYNLISILLDEVSFKPLQGGSHILLVKNLAC